MESIRENIADLATLLVKTSRANENGKLMAVRKKYANKKFARISQIAGKYFVIIPLLFFEFFTTHRSQTGNEVR